MPPKPRRAGVGARRGKWAGTAFERPLDDKPAYPGVVLPREGVWSAKSTAHALEKKLLCYHTYNSERSPSGFPDKVFVGPRGIMFREEKVSDTGDVTDDQAKWILGLRAVGIDAAVWWYPRDWNTGEVQNQLNALARKGPGAVDVTTELGKLMYLATVTPSEVPGAAFLWDAGVKVNREWWRQEANLILHGALQHLPIQGEELTQWLRIHRLPSNATPEQVLAAVRATLLRHEPMNGVPPHDAAQH
jgi:hypothetical protein